MALELEMGRGVPGKDENSFELRLFAEQSLRLIALIIFNEDPHIGTQ